MLGLWMFGSPLEQLWGQQKFLFYFFSTGIGAASLQMAAYAFQFHSVTERCLLNTAGFTTTEIINAFASGRPIQEWFNYVGPEQVQSAYNVYVGSMVGASGALYGVLVAFAFIFPNVELFLIFVPIPIKTKILCAIVDRGDLFLDFLLTLRPHCSFCSHWRSFNRFLNDVLLAENPIQSKPLGLV